MSPGAGAEMRSVVHPGGIKSRPGFRVYLHIMYGISDRVQGGASSGGA